MTDLMWLVRGIERVKETTLRFLSLPWISVHHGVAGRGIISGDPCFVFASHSSQSGERMRSLGL